MTDREKSSAAENGNNLQNKGDKHDRTNIEPCCQICEENVAKYKCPKCMIRTCSLVCVRKHKQLKTCDGVRCKTTYVSMANYNEGHMLSDYRLLEEIARSHNNNERFLDSNKPFLSKTKREKMKRARRMDITLKLLPMGFTQAKMNSTFYDFKKRTFNWHIMWHFPHCEKSMHQRTVPQSRILMNAFLKFWENVHVEHPELHKYNCSEKLLFYMKREDMPANQTKYHKLDSNLNISKNLQGKTIIEYPKIVVVLSDRADNYESNVCEAPPHQTLSFEKHGDRKEKQNDFPPPKKLFHAETNSTPVYEVETFP